MRWILQYGVGLLFWLPGKLYSQHVLYSESFNARSSLHFQVIGKSGSFYWMAKIQKQRSYNRHRAPENLPDHLSLAVYDRRLQWAEELSTVAFPETIKQWLVAGNKGLDQVALTTTKTGTRIITTRYTTAENAMAHSMLVDSLPFHVRAGSCILTRSADQSRILFLAFETAGIDIPRMHMILFDSEWKTLYHKTISDDMISQPFIQDDEIGFPAESFDNLPLKLTNDGEWLMAYASRVTKNFTLFHMCAEGNDFYFRDIRLSPFYKMEDISMQTNDQKKEMTMAIFSSYSKTSFKNVQILGYNMESGFLDVDTSFRFSDQAPQNQYKNVSHQAFINVPGKGFMIMKEYGIPFDFNASPIPTMNEFETAYLLTNYAADNKNSSTTEPAYSVNRGLTPIHVIRNRGDLNLFYFPAIPGDSSWSGVLNMEQHAENNNPDLSYLLIPYEGKLYLIYNSIDAVQDLQPTTTTLDLNGRTTGDALVFWKMKQVLNFQSSRQFSENEYAIPYVNNQQRGFAIIRLSDN